MSVPGPVPRPTGPVPSRISRTRAPAARPALRLAVAGLLFLAQGLLVASSPWLAGRASAATVTVTNGTQFTTTAGAVVHAHGGGMIKVGGFYYWFGENRNADDTFANVSVYRSPDLRNWEFRNNVLTQGSDPDLGVANIERPKVVFNAATGTYVLWMHKENGSDYTQARVAVATSSTVDGTYQYRGSFRPLDHESRDMTVFTDDDGAAYLVSATNSNADLNVYRLTADYLGVDRLVVTLWPGSFREAPALFKRGGSYFLLTSGATGWAPNQQKYATASSIGGSWSALQNVGDSTAYATQTAFVLPVAGSAATSYLYLGDRWAGAWGEQVNLSNYVWLPLTFPSATSLSMSYAAQVSIDTATGAVSGTGSGYVSMVARNSGLCGDVTSGSTADAAAVIQFTCDGSANQQWRLQQLNNGFYQIVARHSEKCLDVNGASSAAGATLIQFTCGSGANQQWRRQDVGNGQVNLVARHSGLCLDVSGSSTASHAALVQSTCSGATSQQWALNGT